MINVIGLGYIGLPTSLVLAKNGVEVVGTDYNEKLVNKLNSNKITFEEKGLEELFQEAKKNNIKFSQEYQKTNFYIIAVPTPYIKETKKIDTKYIIKAVEQVISICEHESIIVIESTISPGTIEKYIKPLTKNTNKVIHFAHAPERIIPGNMISELNNNSRTIGADSLEVAEKVKDIYSKFCKGDIYLTDIKSAELSKVVENTYRDINIAFANELLKICNNYGLNVYEIIKLANKHPRVNILTPGPGVGGHCISVDPWFLVGDYPEVAKLVSTARLINDSMPQYVLDKIIDIMNIENITDYGKIGIYGLTYKENVDDTRESPSIQFYNLLSEEEKQKITFYDPMISDKITENQVFDFNEFIKKVDLIVVMIGHSQIKENTELLNNKIILDTRNLFNQYNNVYKL